MSLAQRRTILDDIHTLPSPFFEDESRDDGTTADEDSHSLPISSTQRESVISHRASIVGIPVEDGKEVWQALSYDAFHAPPQDLAELQQFESVPPETGENVAAYEVSTARRICQVAFAVTACVLASGIVCGFAALKPILIAEGVYRSLCPVDWPAPSPGLDGEAQIPCPAQDMRLNLFFITASITLNVATVLAGYVLDHHGRRACYLLAAAILFLGSGCMSLAFYLGEESRVLAWFDGYITGNLLLGLGGTFLFVSSYQLSNAFPRRAGLVVALVTGAFDASAAVFLFYRLAYEATQHRFRPAIFFLAFALTIPPLLCAAELTLMPRAAYSTRREYQAALAAAQDPTQDERDSDDERFAHEPAGALGRERRRRADEREARMEALEAVAGNADERAADMAAARGRQEASGVHGILQQQQKQQKQQKQQATVVAAQMATPWFWLLLLMTATQMTRMNYFIATVRAQYRYMLSGDEDAAGAVNGLFDAALPVAGVLTTPFIGVLLNEMPVWATLAVLTVLTAVLGILNCVSGSLDAAYATVIMFVLYRPLYYSAVSDYATKVFGFATFGRIYGTVICASGAGQFIQPALDALTHGPLHNNPVPVNIVFGVTGTVLSAALTLFVYVKTRENKERRKQQQHEGEEDGERRALLSERGQGSYGGVRS
ncbi:MFS general substrate transporter [Cryphonectria parasitica EP155]|uniref:MFS general substrate transporter n=1 Tax=Cryphonectria parasitica (strain ATCC 38755 / EP155) TaxID=660469 RepID=A0A9P4YDP5_CRYP1|nr:MFS general substrate transporter [Cryphonectria parasitica EP155]KAF3771116.1 MFS general substrate transporter [Cryphonectria parasitica EP155]